MKIFLLTLLIMVVANHLVEVQAEVLKISVYYEALCPYCAQFITKQLYPGYKKIGSNLKLEFVPYGNTIRTKKNGKWVFECQHGPDECAINKIEGCGLAKNHNQKKQLEFVKCVEIRAESNRKDLTKIAECATHLGLTGKQLLKCAQGPEGNRIFNQLYEKQKLAGEIGGVPFINFNGTHTDSFEEAALSNFLNAACEKFTNKPKGCP